MRNSYDAIIARIMILVTTGLLVWHFLPAPHYERAKPVLAFNGFYSIETTRPRLPIVMYHRVSDKALPNDGGRVLPTLEFEEQLMLLRDEGYTTLLACEYQKILSGEMECPEKPIMLTFDDGYDDNLLEAYPLLRRYRMKANFYIITGSIGAMGHMTESQLIRIDPRYVEIGSHTVNHCALRNCSRNRLIRELVDSRLALEFMLGREVKSFAFPYGAYDELAIEIVKGAGYEIAFTTERGLNDWAGSPHELKRVTVARGMPLSVFKRAIGLKSSNRQVD